MTVLNRLKVVLEFPVACAAMDPEQHARQGIVARPCFTFEIEADSRPVRDATRIGPAKGDFRPFHNVNVQHELLAETVWYRCKAVYRSRRTFSRKNGGQISLQAADETLKSHSSLR